MEADAKSTQKLSFKAFLSHAYEAEELNIEFFKMLDEIADVQFEVDSGLKNLNVTRLERRIRDCDAFVGLYPFPGAPTDEPSPGETLKASRYFRLEMELAARAARPSIVFYDRRFQSAIQPLKGFSEKTFGPHDVRDMATRFRLEIKTAFQEFCRRLGAEIQGRAAGFEANRSRREVGLLVPRGKSGYPKSAIGAIEEVAHEVGCSELLDLGWPPVANARLFDQLDSLDWIFADVGPQTAATGMLGLIHSRFIPAIRMLKHGGLPAPDKWADSMDIGRLFGSLDVGYRKDIVYWRGDVKSLRTQLRDRAHVALSPPNTHEVIKTHEEALKYFRLATEKRQVFVSYASADHAIAQQLVSVLREHFPTVFDYRDGGESLPPGTNWREKIKSEILSAQFGILLLSQAYDNSGYCKWEGGLLVDGHHSRQLPLFPVLLDVKSEKMPTGLENLQAARLNKGDNPDDLAHRLVEEMKKTPVPGNKSA